MDNNLRSRIEKLARATWAQRCHDHAYREDAEALDRVEPIKCEVRLYAGNRILPVALYDYEANGRDVELKFRWADKDWLLPD